MKALMLLANPFTNDARVYAEAKALIKADHEVTVIAWDRERKNPSRQTWDGIDVVRVRTRLSPKFGAAWRLWNGFNLLLWWRQAYRLALTVNREGRVDVIHCHDLDTLSIGTRLKRKLKIPLIYDAHEIFGYMVAGSLPRWMVKMIFWLERRLLKKVDRIINTCEPHRRCFAGVTDKPISIVMNCKPLQSLEYRPPDGGESFSLLYIGGLWKSRMILGLVAAAKELPGVRCLIGGIGHPGYIQALKEECAKTSNVSFLGSVPVDQVIPMTMKAAVVFCMFDPGDPNNVVGMPNKLFEAMVCGRPIICTRGTYSGEVTEQEEIGLAIEYSEQALEEAIIKLRDTPGLSERLGRNALKAAITKYNWKKEEEKLIELYQGLHI